jgi:hypothetical protein
MRLFGIETLLKRAWRTSRFHSSVIFARATGHPSYRFFHEQIEPDVSRLDRVTVLPERDVIFLPVEKNANSKTKRILAEVRGVRNPFSRKDRTKFRTCASAHEIPIQEFYRILHSPNRLVFAIVRDPYERVYSAWVNKFRGKPLVQSPPFQKPTTEINTYLRLRGTIDPSLPAGADAQLSFDQFLTYVEGIIDGWTDPHIVPQSRFLKVPFAPIDRLIRLESYIEGMQPVMQHLKAPPELSARLGEKINATGLGKNDYVITPGQRAIIERLYRDDFEAFGYRR